MRILAASLFLVLSLLAAGASQIVTVSVTVTNAAGVVGSTNTFTLNASTITVTNDISASPSTLIQETNVTAVFTTNLFTHLGAYPVSAFHIPFMASETNVSIRGFVDETMTATLAGEWGVITYATNTISKTVTVRVPHTVEASSNQIHIASMLLSYINVATNSWPTNATALTNYLTLGAVNQAVHGLKWWMGTNYMGRSYMTNVNIIRADSIGGTVGSLTNGYWKSGALDTPAITNATLISGTLGSITNGYWTNGIAQNLIVTNLYAYGTAALTVQIGNSSEASASGAVSIGQSSEASAIDSTAIGGAAQTFVESGTALGYAAKVGVDGTTEGGAGTAIGNNSSVLAEQGLALGWNADVARYHTNSAAIGANVTTTKTNQIMIGASTHRVDIPGYLEAAAITNAFTRGTNVMAGASLAIRRYDHSSLADGDNAGVILGTNHWIRLTAGPTAAFALHGFANGQDGLNYKVSNYTGQNMTIANASGTEPAAGNRILTGTGADMVVTNYPGSVEIIYDSSASRWILLNYTD